MKHKRIWKTKICLSVFCVLSTLLLPLQQSFTRTTSESCLNPYRSHHSLWCLRLESTCLHSTIEQRSCCKKDKEKKKFNLSRKITKRNVQLIWFRRALWQLKFWEISPDISMIASMRRRKSKSSFARRDYAQICIYSCSFGEVPNFCLGQLSLVILVVNFVVWKHLFYCWRTTNLLGMQVPWNFSCVGRMWS